MCPRFHVPGLRVRTTRLPFLLSLVVVPPLLLLLLLLLLRRLRPPICRSRLASLPRFRLLRLGEAAHLSPGSARHDLLLLPLPNTLPADPFLGRSQQHQHHLGRQRCLRPLPTTHRWAARRLPRAHQHHRHRHCRRYFLLPSPSRAPASAARRTLQKHPVTLAGLLRGKLCARARAAAASPRAPPRATAPRARS